MSALTDLNRMRRFALQGERVGPYFMHPTFLDEACEELAEHINRLIPNLFDYYSADDIRQRILAGNLVILGVKVRVLRGDHAYTDKRRYQK